MDALIAKAVFELAGQSTHWTRTNLGDTTQVTLRSYTYSVLVPRSDEDPVKAEITGREGYGGTEHMQVQATWVETISIVDAARGALALS